MYLHCFNSVKKAVNEISKSGKVDDKNNNDKNDDDGHDDMALESSEAMNDKESINAELATANSKSNNNGAFDFEEFLKMESIGDFLSVCLYVSIVNIFSALFI